MRILTAQLIATLLLLQPTLTSAADNITDDLLNGKINADINTRYEHAARDGLKAAEAMTIRSRLGYTTGSFYDLSAKLEIENIWSPFRVPYDDGTNNPSRFSWLYITPAQRGTKHLGSRLITLYLLDIAHI